MSAEQPERTAANAIHTVNREIEHLRALAILFTLVQHFPMMLHWPQPPRWVEWIYGHFAFWIGVDLFLVISGFVVTQSLLRAFQSSDGSLGGRFLEVQRFWIRRAFRLFPLAWLGVASVLFATWWFNDSGAFGDFSANAQQAVWIVLYVYNWFTYDFFRNGVNISALGIYWSLSLEEQFYLVLPLLVLLLRTRWLLAFCAFGIAAQFFLLRPAPWHEPLWGLRTEALLWGVLLAFAARTTLFERFCQRDRIARWKSLCVMCLIALAILVLPYWGMKVSFTTGFVTLWCLAAVALASVQRGWVWLPDALNSIADWLGSRSYALYVWHAAAFLLTREIGFRVARMTGIELNWNWALVLLVFGLALASVAAEFSYRVIEQPLRLRGRRIAEKYH